MSDVHKGTVGVALTALLASSATLVCCVLPATLVSIGAGAALVGLISAFPQLIWLSEHKIVVFGVAGLLLMVSGAVIGVARRLPCPTDPVAARTCTKLRKWSQGLYVIAVAAFLLGFVFAFMLATD